MARGFWIKRSSGSVFDDVRNFYVKTAIGAWSQVTDAWVKTSTGTWRSFWSALMAPDTRVELIAAPELTSMGTVKLMKFRGKNYHWTPTPQSLRYYFKEIYNDTSTQYIGPSGSSGDIATNPSAGSFIYYPSSSTYITIDPAGNQYTSGGTSRYYFEVRATGASGSIYSSVSTDVVELTTPQQPSISVNFLSSTSALLTISPFSYNDYAVTGRYIVYTYDSVGGYIYSGGGRGGYAADSMSKQVTITGLTGGREYVFYVLPTTGDTGSTPSNYNGYPGIEGYQTSINDTPTLQATPSITGNAYPGGTVSVSNGSWDPTPTSYSYQWQRSINYVTSNYSDIQGAISSSYSIPTDFIANGYYWLRCNVTATRNGSSATATSYPIEVIAQQLATPALSITSNGYNVYPYSYANVTVANYYSAYTGNETWSASISPSSGVTYSQNVEFPEEWNFSNLSPGVSYTITISVNRAGFLGASSSVNFTGLPRRAFTPTFSIYYGSTSDNGYIYVESTDAQSVTWQIYRTANGTGTTGYGNQYSYNYYDGGTVNSYYGIYYLPRNGYYYMVAYGNNSDGSTSNSAYSNGNGTAGTQRNWFYTGPANSPSAGYSYSDGSNAVLNWNAYSNYNNSRMNASYTNNVSSYEVYWYPSNTAPSSSTSGDYTGISGTSYTASQGYSTTRYYWVRGVTSSGNITGYSPWIALGSVTTGAAPGVAPSGISVSLSPGGTQMAGTTITASVSVSGGTSPITYSIQIFKATGVDPTNSSTGLESGTTSASHTITSGEAAGTPDRFIAYATASNAYGSVSGYSNVVTSTPYVAPVTYAWYCTTSTQCGGAGNCSYTTPGYNASSSGTGYNTTCSYNSTGTYPGCQSTTCSSCTLYYCTQYDYADSTSPNYYGHCYSVGACDAPVNTGGGCCQY